MGKKRVGNFRTNILGGFNRQDVIDYIEHLHKQLDTLEKENALLLQKLPAEDAENNKNIKEKLTASIGLDPEPSDIADMTVTQPVDNETINNNDGFVKDESTSIYETANEIKTSLGIEIEDTQEATSEKKADNIEDSEIATKSTGENVTYYKARVDSDIESAESVKVAVKKPSPKSVSIRKRRKK